jgi:hypothetical protein
LYFKKAASIASMKQLFLLCDLFSFSLDVYLLRPPPPLLLLPPPPEERLLDDELPELYDPLDEELLLGEL